MTHQWPLLQQLIFLYRGIWTATSLYTDACTTLCTLYALCSIYLKTPYPTILVVVPYTAKYIAGIVICGRGPLDVDTLVGDVVNHICVCVLLVSPALLQA